MMTSSAQSARDLGDIISHSPAGRPGVLLDQHVIGDHGTGLII